MMKDDVPDTAQSRELLRLIVEEVDEAREVYELAAQLAAALPIKSFDDIIKTMGDRGSIKFRGKELEVTQFADMVPATFFPIEDRQTLVALVYQAVKLAPRTHQYADSDPANARRRLRRLGLLGLPTGLLGPIPGPALLGMVRQSESKGQKGNKED
jgi:hypothetical protein